MEGSIELAVEEDAAAGVVLVRLLFFARLLWFRALTLASQDERCLILLNRDWLK